MAETWRALPRGDNLEEIERGEFLSWMMMMHLENLEVDLASTVVRHP